MNISETVERAKVFGADVAEGYLALNALVYSFAVAHSGYDVVADSFAHDRTIGDVFDSAGNMINTSGSLLVSYMVLVGVQNYRERLQRRVQ